ncbi:MAG: EamA family transporter RarD [Synechococcales cyanobacterium]
MDRIGIIFALLAYGAWGLLPIYWKLFGGISPLEVISHRVFWSSFFLMALVRIQGQQHVLRQLLRPRVMGVLLLTASILAGNWGLYIYGVNTNRVVETSLGYFINPLVTVLLGVVFLGERLNRLEWLAVALATAGVSFFVWQGGEVPWIALGLACSFACYGLGRKMLKVPALAGLTLETLLLSPFAIAVLAGLALHQDSHWGADEFTTVLLVGCGVVTALPLLWFNQAAQRLPLSTLGFFQYVAPTIQLGLGVVLYGEPFTLVHGVTFTCIWTALALYTWAKWQGRPMSANGS